MNALQIDLPTAPDLEDQFLISACSPKRLELIGRLSEVITPEHFSHPLRAAVWQIICQMAERGQMPTAETVFDHFRKNSGYERETNEFILRLFRISEAIAPASTYVEALCSYYIRRKGIEAAMEIITDLTTPDPTWGRDDLIQTIDSRIEQLFGHEERDTDPVGARKVYTETMEEIDRAQTCEDGVIGIRIGFQDLDERFGGLQKAQLYVLGGRPSMGKTAFALSILENAANSNAKVMFVSLEMRRTTLFKRLLASKSGVPLKSMNRRQPATEAIVKLAQFGERIAELPFTIDDKGGQTIGMIRRRARRLQKRKGLDLLIVDHLHLVQPPTGISNPVEQISHNTQAFKNLAKELDIPIVLLCQLSRGTEGREDKRPMLSDLRGSGSIEQDADVVMFVYREEYYLDRNPNADPNAVREARGKFEIITQKHREGEIGVDLLHFNPVRQLFTDWSGPS